MPRSWRIAAASATGSAHGALDLPNQDACWTQVCSDACGRSHVVLVVADGAGSAAHAELGAQCAVAAVGAAAVRWCQDPARGALDQTVLEVLVSTGAHALQQLAGKLDCGVRELSCTLLLTLVTPDQCGFAQLGDGLMVYTDPEQSVRVAFWPQAGEYANVTEFLSAPDFLAHLRCEVIRPAPQQLALSTDGLQRLALRIAEQQAHAPFFIPFWSALATLEHSRQSEFSAQLQQWLASAPVQQRTDDDTTLVLAVTAASAP